MNVSCVCPTPEATLALGAVAGGLATPGLLFALQGPLGAGKTLFTKGLAKGLGVPGWRYVTSPTFALHNVYRGRLELHHVDLYRIEDASDFESLGLVATLYGDSVCVIEWPDIFFEEFPSDRVLVRFQLDDTEARVLTFRSSGPHSEALLEGLRASPCCKGFGEE